MNYPHHPQGQGTHWQNSAYPPQYPAPSPPPRRNTAGIIMLAVSGVAIVALIVAIVAVIALNNNTADPPAAHASPDSTAARTADDRPTATSDTRTGDSDQVADDTGSGSSPVFPDAMDGDWQGTMSQYDMSGNLESRWDLELHIEGGESTAEAELSMSNGRTCTWGLLVTGSGDDSVDLQYTTTNDGNGTCTPSGHVHIVVKDGQLLVGVATEQPDGSISTADGVLNPS
ncbi:hypothetical protein JCM3263A_28080 [Thermobifida fusca]|uniref:Uncharacterized protein n=1 Tax=Thermobifida fusca TM51 TaxID=1169414 RepID=A0A9P2WS69_THEFU|nr:MULTISPECIES: hypothetical protein [Thermobifida]EOR72844.1 hypothetical protein TM51_00240 [Thermobifida fusca TM51]MBO2528538.1 hypothetical protein [Thermobifida sp.]MDD6791100.1 hypothetical protein [Thermobifida fusca]PPS94258.1 hypothetical protein BH05_06320 [Thermobifida fusca]PZN60480.1 MAG: hypothetical protein DIU53_15135 [Thermobifida fusca]